MFFVEIFLEGIIHSIDGGFSLLIAIHGVNIGFLDEEYNKKEAGKSANDNYFENSKTLFLVHFFIITYSRKTVLTFFRISSIIGVQ